MENVRILNANTMIRCYVDRIEKPTMFTYTLPLKEKEIVLGTEEADKYELAGLIDQRFGHGTRDSFNAAFGYRNLMERAERGYYVQMKNEMMFSDDDIEGKL